MMRNWTELLPAGVQNPIVIEIRCPDSWVTPAARNRLKAEVGTLAEDQKWLDSKSEMSSQLGADALSILFLAKDEHWLAKEGEPGRPDRRPSPPAGDVFIRVHLPPAVATTPEDEARVTQAVMDWFESSKLGRACYSEGHGAGMRRVSARGVRYSKLQDLTYIDADVREEPEVH